MATPPFDIAAGLPADSDIVSGYPLVERTFRDMVESILAREHDIIIGAGGASAHHKFGRGSTATRDAITDWVVGSVWINTDFAPSAWQAVKSIGPVVWETLTPSPNDDNVLVTQWAFNGLW